MTEAIVAELLIEKLIQQEQLLADYYDMCEEELPEYAKIWNFLHKEEKGHMRALQTLEPRFKSGEVYLTSDLVNLKTLQYSLDFLIMKTEEIKQIKHTPIELLELALQFEVCTLEAIVFDSIGSENQAILDKLQWIQKGTEKHAKILKQAIEQYKHDHETMMGRITGLFHTPAPPDPEEEVEE